MQRLRVAFYVFSFPKLSNTFVMEQITGLLDRGYEVDIFAKTRHDFATLPAALARYALEERMRFLPIPRSWALRAASAVRILSGPAGLHRAHLDALNPRRHGLEALSLKRLHAAASFVRAGHYDVLHCQFGHLGPEGENLVRTGALDAALVTSFRGADISMDFPSRPHHYRALFRNGDLHLPVCQEFRRRLLAAGVPSERVHVHHSGIDLKKFPFVQRSAPTGTLRILFVGRLVEKKGVTYAIQALAHLARAGRSVELIVIGEGPLNLELREQARTSGLEGLVKFVGSGSHEEVIRMMLEADVLVAPSVTARDGDQEGIPNVLKEAMACGMPVVSTWHSGVPELIEHGVTGFLAAEHDAAGLAKCLELVIEHPDRSVSMAHAARTKVETEFDAELLNDTLVSLYEQVVAMRAAGAVQGRLVDPAREDRDGSAQHTQE